MLRNKDASAKSLEVLCSRFHGIKKAASPLSFFSYSTLGILIKAALDNVKTRFRTQPVKH